MFAFIASQVLGSVAECGGCRGSRGKNVTFSPQFPAPVTKRASSMGRSQESYVVYYPEDVDCSPLKSRRDSFHFSEETDQNDTFHHGAEYDAELGRCSAELVKVLKKERRRLAGPREGLSSVEQSTSDSMRLRHRRTMDSLRSHTKDSLRVPTPTFVAAVQTPHVTRGRCDTDASVESDASPTDRFDGELPQEMIDTLYECGEVSKRVQSIRHHLEKTAPMPDMRTLSMALQDGPAGSARHSRFVQQQQEQRKVQDEIKSFQGLLGEKLGRLGGKTTQSVQPAEFRKTADPAEAVRDGVLRYHGRCTEVFESSLSTRQFHMLEGFKKDLKDPIGC